MNHFQFLMPCILISGVLHGEIFFIPQAGEKERVPQGGGSDIPLLFGGCGGVYFLAEPGELWVEVEKRDRNRNGSHTELRAILAGPDRMVLQEVAIPDDGRPRGSGLGPPQRARLSTQVERKGVLALNITVSTDRYGQKILWGFRTNCPRYLIETSRGHKDERHQEPLVLASPDRPGDVCFLPRPGAFQIDLSGLKKGIGDLQLFRGDGTLVETLKVDSQGQANAAIPSGTRREAVPWRLHLPSAQAVVNIDGLTRWNREDPHSDLCYWTPQLSSWFPFLPYRWLLAPYRRIAYGEPGREGEIQFQVHSSSDRPQTVQLSLEFSGASWPVRLLDDRVSLGLWRTSPVKVRYTAPPAGETRVCHVRATPLDAPEFSTYSTLTVVGGKPPASRPLRMPIQLKPYQHENEQFGYLPDYPVENQVYFDPQNHPFVRIGNGVATLRDGKWVALDFRFVVKSSLPQFQGKSFGTPSTKIAFDSENVVYLIATCSGTAALLHSTDGARTFSATTVPGQIGVFDLEQFSGHNIPEGPPPILRFTQRGRDPKLIWRRINDLELFVPEKVDGRIEVGKPVLISKQCIGLSAHSGIPSSVVSRGNRIHVAWGEATDPKKQVPGVPTYVATYDGETGKLGAPALVGYGPPPNDVHNSPSITMDGQGYLHVLVGTHGRPFQYARSLQPNDAHSGWTEAVPAGKDLPQTYIGLVCGKDDALHVVFRLWRGGEPYPHSTHATLAYMRKLPGQSWEPPRILLVSPFSEYSIFYHRLTIDQGGRLFLSYDYWSTYWFYRIDHFGRRRALLMSPDGGGTWKLAETRDLERE